MKILLAAGVPEPGLNGGSNIKHQDKGEDLRSSGEGLRGFKSHPPHYLFFEKGLEMSRFSEVNVDSEVLVPLLVIDYQAVKKQFIMWLRSRGLSQEHYVEKMIGYLDRFAKPVKEPMDIVAMFDGLGDSQRRHLANGFRNIFNFYESQGFVNREYLDLLRKNLPSVSVGVDLKVPEPQEIIHSLMLLKDSEGLSALYNLILDSGLRLVEGIRLYNSLINDGVDVEKHEGFSVVPLGYFRGTKLAYYGFISEASLRMVRAQSKPLIYKKVAGCLTKKIKGVVSRKYLRKFLNDIMTSEQLNVPESVADFIEGRVPRSIGARHYMQLKRKAIGFYPRYEKYLRSIREKADLL